MAKALKKAAIYLGLAEGDLESTDKVARGGNTTVVAEDVQQDAVVTPLHRVTPVQAAQAAPLSEILTVRPHSYSDAPEIAEHFREGVPVILNLSQMSDVDARRIIDFAGGLVMGLRGHIERVTGKVFLLTPAHVAVADLDQPGHSDSGSFFVAPQQ